MVFKSCEVIMTCKAIVVMSKHQTRSILWYRNTSKKHTLVSFIPYMPAYSLNICLCTTVNCWRTWFKYVLEIIMAILMYDCISKAWRCRLTKDTRENVLQMERTLLQIWHIIHSLICWPYTCHVSNVFRDGITRWIEDDDLDAMDLTVYNITVNVNWRQNTPGYC